MQTIGTHWRIGVDEAGYGPNLGPLVIAATAWRVPNEGPADLYDRLATVIARAPARDDRLVIADSKSVYSSGNRLSGPGSGLSGLERPVLASLRESPANLAELIESLDADPVNQRITQPWRASHNPALPTSADPAAVGHARGRMNTACVAAGISPPCLAARLVYPAEFNDLVDQHATKGAALSHTTLSLVRHVLEACSVDVERPTEPVYITLDKHGGRNRYASLVQHWLPEAPITVLEESRPQSRYRVGQQIELCFRSKGEAELPVALASMTAKLLRELTMLGLNTYWKAEVPGLNPTAGYPLDAKRFKAQIAARQALLGIADHALWRNR
ncbi:hypothetical protein [Botrimarina hoheduenensis]|uniref:Uncharacterized protein n=1 Tax=Botrimarina hoheduenensis TaxID=2528000 RepID=A0A5C5W794_9BACT|nr:hypothetical protein [Botrimarina hoheduenensis]TWT46776.1 hypothetical protein Pla111_18770 [Botrimarina hoheduenensis]